MKMKIDLHTCLIHEDPRRWITMEIATIITYPEQIHPRPRLWISSKHGKRCAQKHPYTTSGKSASPVGSSFANCKPANGGTITIKQCQ